MKNEEDNKLKLINLLRQIFRLESEDLDFGIYKIMNYRKKEIKDFIEKELIETIEEQLKLLSEEEKRKLIAKAESFKKKDSVVKYLEAVKKREDGRIGVLEELEDVKKYKKTQEELKKIKVSEDVEKVIYNHLINFFSRYYDNGDFISKRRYGRGERYVVPYNGEETLLHWASKDQYYIKTIDYFRKYTFKATPYKGSLVVNFRVTEVEEEKEGVKAEKKKFFVLGDDPCELKKYVLDIYFEYRGLTDDEKRKFGERAKQEDVNKHIIEVLKKNLSRETKTAVLFTGENGIEKHLNRYTKRNTMDYFIHKNLRGFLQRELDFYIKNEILKFEDLRLLGKEEYYSNVRLYLLEARVIRNIALKITQFLGQIENFQKKLWEKKRFVIKTDYVITLDKIKQYAGEKFLESTVNKVLDNKAQLNEWKELFGIEVKKKTDLVADVKLDGKEWKKLPIDTKYFDEDFKWELIIALGQVRDLDQILDGVLIKSDSWQALNLLLNKYRENVGMIYIDPPFNTGSDEFLYKDNYQHSSWLSMMENRLKLARYFLSEKGVIFNHIDDNEVSNLRLLIDYVFNSSNFLSQIAYQRSGAAGLGQGGKFVVNTAEFILAYCNNFDKVSFLNLEGETPLAIKHMKRYNGILIDEGNKQLIAKFVAKSNKEPVKIFKHSEYKVNTISFSDFPRRKKEIHSQYLKNFEKIFRLNIPQEENKFQHELISKMSDGLYSVEYIPSRGRYGGQLVTNYYYKKQLLAWLKSSAKIKGEEIIKTNKLTDFWSHGDIPKADLANEGGVTLRRGKKPEQLLFRLISMISKRGDLILDFTLGSGTTIAVAHKFGNKWVGIELDENMFNNKALVRMKNVLNGERSGVSKKVNWQGGGFFKYQYLEQYEDSLENIEFEKPQKSLREFQDYFVRYMLDFETKNSQTFLNINNMENPFNYRLRIVENLGPKDANIDLIETFNYLLGVSVKKINKIEDNKRRYILVFGEVDNKRVAIIWRSVKNIDFERDKKIIEEHIKELNPDEIYVNGDCAVRNFRQIENELKKLMFERVE